MLDISQNIVAVVGIVMLALMEISAILAGQDGAYFLPIVAAIAGIAGFKLSDYVRQKKDGL